MKNIFLAAVVILALSISGISGTLAGFSDTEISENNFLEVGSLDLKVGDGTNGEFEDPNVPPLIHVSKVWPRTSQAFEFNIQSLSDPDDTTAHVYINFKDILCAESPDENHPEGRTEPEEVAENGGILAGQAIGGLGSLKQESTLADFIEIVLEFDTNGDGALEPITGNPLWDSPDAVYLGDIDSKWIDMGLIPAGQLRKGRISLHFGNWPEERWDLNYFTNDMPFNDWPTNAFQLDRVMFNVEFALTQEPIPASYLYP
ncbi:MAG: hypothetical protein ABIB93_06110 [Chloroflexota bacterium]